MNAIFVESHNNYMAKSATDDMSWTPSLDKRIYKLLTYVYGGVCVCSKNTYVLLPNKMKKDPNRLFVVAQRDGENNLLELDKKYHNAVLIGGPSFLRQAYDLGVVHNFVITTVKTDIVSEKTFFNPFINELTKLQHRCKIDFGDIIINIYQKTK